MTIKTRLLAPLLITFLSLNQAVLADDHATAHSAALDRVLAAQSDEHKARYTHRNPKETLAFFGVVPGMSVGEVLPGGGWYSKILINYLGSEGKLIGLDYAHDMWAKWPEGGFVTDEFLEKRKTWPQTWVETAGDWPGENRSAVSAATLATIPEDLDGSLDAMLFIRAIHHLSRFNDQGGYLDNAIASSYKALKPGGIVGVVQHHARDDRSDEWADGSNGYMKKGVLIDMFSAAGFELVGESDINANELDQAKEGDNVWRLGDDTEESKAIGESNRLTLKFVKPAS